MTSAINQPRHFLEFLLQSNPAQRIESEEPLTAEKPVLQKKKQINNVNIKAKSRYRLQTKWIRF